jgi:putative aldouronate transport system permease protein
VFPAVDPMIGKGYLNTGVILVFGLSVNMILTSIGAYFMSRKNVMFNRTITLMIIFTMYFSGGLIPFYMTVKELGMENSLWALIIPSSINTFNLIILRTAFASIPDSLEESARLEGAGHVSILFKIVIPLSKATMSVIALYYAVFHWNSWFNAMIFLTNRQLFPLQLILQEILIQNDTSSMTQMVNAGDSSFIGETVKYAVIIVSAAPILCVYPFIQKYFVQGVMIGAVKG